MAELMDAFKKTAQRQLLRYAVSKQMFCPVKGCGKVLDYRKAVNIEFTFGKSITMCSKCYKSDPVQAQIKKFKEYIKEIIEY